MFLIAILLVMSIATFMLDGKNPLTVGTTLWYLNSSDQNILWVAADSEQFLTYKENMEQHILEYLPRLDGVSRGEWEVAEMDQQKIVYHKKGEGDEEEQVTIYFEPYLDRYIMFTYDVG